MSSFASIKPDVIIKHDLEKLLNLDFNKRDEKAQGCKILAKYAKHFDSEYGIGCEDRYV